MIPHLVLDDALSTVATGRGRTSPKELGTSRTTKTGIAIVSPVTTRDNVFDCERDKLDQQLEAFSPFDWIQAAGAKKRETDLGASTEAKGKNLDYELVGSPESSDWTFEGYPRTNLPDRAYHGILIATRAARGEFLSLVELLFRFLPTAFVNIVGSTCISRRTAVTLRALTWKDTGWNYQFFLLLHWVRFGISLEFVRP
jgi:hypothetical protein